MIKIRLITPRNMSLRGNAHTPASLGDPLEPREKMVSVLRVRNRRPKAAGRVQSLRVPKAATRSDAVEIELTERPTLPWPKHRVAAFALLD